jgi:hypothetical protein
LGLFCQFLKDLNLQLIFKKLKCKTQMMKMIVNLGKAIIIKSPTKKDLSVVLIWLLCRNKKVMTILYLMLLIIQKHQNQDYTKQMKRIKILNFISNHFQVQKIWMNKLIMKYLQQKRILITKNWNIECRIKQFLFKLRK